MARSPTRELDYERDNVGYDWQYPDGDAQVGRAGRRGPLGGAHGWVSADARPGARTLGRAIDRARLHADATRRRGGGPFRRAAVNVQVFPNARAHMPASQWRTSVRLRWP